MKANLDAPAVVAGKEMLPPSAYPQPHNHNQPNLDQVNQQSKRRQSRFDPIGSGSDADEEGYGELGHRHNFRKLNEEEPRSSFSLPGIKSLLNPSSSDRESSSSSTLYQQSPSLPSLVSNSPGGSPSTSRTSRYSSLASGSSISADSHGWWAPGYDRALSESSNPRSTLPPALTIDDHDHKRRRSDQPQSARDQDEQARLKWMAQSRNASFPSTAVTEPGSASPSPTMRSMQPPAPPSATMSRNARSHHEQLSPRDGRPLVPSRSLSLVSGPLANSFADLSASERERQGSLSQAHVMPPPFPSPLGMDRERRFSFQQEHGRPQPQSPNHVEAQRLRSNTATPPDTNRVFSHPPESYNSANRSGSGGAGGPRAGPTARLSLSELIMAQSGDAQAMGRGRYSTDSAQSDREVKRRSSNSSIYSNGTPGAAATVNLNSDDGHTPTARYHRTMRDGIDRDGNPMGGMDVLAESARRVSEEEEHRRGSMGLEDREESPKAGGPGGPKYQCAYCSKTFSRPSSLRIHTYSHTGERPFVCQEPSCGRRFSVQSNLKRHAKVHQLGQAGGASLHQLHNGPIPPRGPGPGASQGAHPYYAPPTGYAWDNRYPSQPHPQPRGQHYHGHGKEWNDGDVEEDELDDEEEMMEEEHQQQQQRARVHARA